MRQTWRRLGILLLTAWVAKNAAGGPARGPLRDGDGRESGRSGGAFSLFNDNDFFARTDRRYTNGAWLGWTWPAPDRPEAAAATRRLAVSLQQLMNTPEDVRRPGVPAGEQPYAGYLGVSLAFHASGPRSLDTTSIDLGVIGPASLAGATQKAFHRAFGFKVIGGWDVQLGNEPVLGVSLDHREKLFLPAAGRGPRADAAWRAGAALGNAFTAAWMGGEVRAGWNLPSGFAPLAASFGAGPSGPPDGEAVPGWSAYGYLAASAQAVLRDAFLDGNLSGEGTSLDRHLGRVRIEAGWTLRWRRLSLSFGYVAQTRRYATERRGHVYGRAGLSYRF
jgi:hypothetical protein